MRRHLTDGGGFAMYNYYREDWSSTVAGTVAEAFGQSRASTGSRASGQAVISVALV